MNLLRIWGIPLAAMALFFELLIWGIPYAAGYGWCKVPLSLLIWQTWSIPEWQHAALVPFICVFLIYLQKDKILKTPIEGSNWGALCILFGVFVYCLGLRAELHYFGFAAIQILIAGLIIWFWGLRIFRLVGFAWLFLLFMWPLPFLNGEFSMQLRLFMCHIASDFLNLIGVDTTYHGTAILSSANAAAGLQEGAKFQIDIADPCSGLHSLFALMMVSVLAAYVCLDKAIPRILVFLGAIPLAIIGNAVRIILLVLATEHFGASFAIGTEENPSWFHMGCGYLVYIIALGLMFGLITFLNSKWLGLNSQEKSAPAPLAPSPSGI